MEKEVQASRNIRMINFIMGLILLMGIVFSGWIVMTNQEAASAVNKSADTVTFTRHDATYSVASLGEGNLIAVGMFGRIFRSSGEGRAWEEISSPTTEHLFGVAFRDDHNGIAVGANGTYLDTSDGGHTWNVRDMTTTSNTVQGHDLLTVVLEQDGNGLITGTFGLLWRTDSGGNTWEAITIPWEKILADVWENYGSVEAHLYDAVIKKPYAWVVGEYGLVLVSTDGGQSFEQHRGGQFTDNHLFEVAVDPADFKHAVAVGQAGLIVSTSDGGASWKESNRWETDLYDVLIHDGGAVISGDLGTVLYLPDVDNPDEYKIVAAAGWKNVITLGDSWITDVQHLNQNHFLVLGKGGFRNFSLPSQQN